MSRDQNSTQEESFNIVNMANTAVGKSSTHKAPKMKLLCSVSGLPISLAVAVNTFIMILVATILLLSQYGVIPAKKTGFYCGDPLYSHKYTGDTITSAILGFTAVALILLIILLTEISAHGSWRKINRRRTWIHFQECIVGVIVVFLLTAVAKLLVGEHRPHFFDVCQPDTAKNCTKGEFVESFECTNTEQTWLTVFDSSLSFPSGHSSISWFLGMLLSYIIQTTLTTVNTGSLMKPFLISVCLTWSLVCSLSRITDRRHHWWDVLAGTTIGILCSLVSMMIIRKKILAMEKKVIDSEVETSEEDMA
ncbi:unnamed protein product [Phaedon cochleariae]|uniref:Phosphatidic acid phosphatase type 2/haloperoxidase domain-containing protein n=1 Tax=Phaedon cochleariae TaxID=80249 RepID=A0A9P0GUM1_PHACE|nr:unnamed protein product [Phaedon cochleariae]